MIAILPHAPEHTDGVIDLVLPIQQQEFGIPITLEDQPDLLDVAGFYRKGAGDFWVAVDDGKVVGSIALIDIGGGRAALRKMFVAAPYRGASFGMARGLLDTVVAHCLERGVREILLGTTAKYLAAHRFYEKNGFREIRREELPASFPVMAVDSKFYVRTLREAP
jgi:GNAT superfamily N-acetyltransferase